VLVVPYPRRRRVEMILRAARVEAEWVPVPGAEAIRERDRERMLEKLSAPVEITEEEQAIADRLLAEKTPQEIALALVRAYSQSLPQPEELADAAPEAARSHRREGFDDTVWFRMDIGRRQNADPR
jgi:ATP-dependent RNA helicase DeaD